MVQAHQKQILAWEEDRQRVSRHMTRGLHVVSEESVVLCQ